MITVGKLNVLILISIISCNKEPNYANESGFSLSTGLAISLETAAHVNGAKLRYADCRLVLAPNNTSYEVLAIGKRRLSNEDMVEAKKLVFEEIARLNAGKIEK